MSESSKDKIIKAANRLFVDKGYDNTSVRDIASLAEVNVASINYHFGSKQGLFEAMVKDFTENKFFGVVQALEPADTVEEFKLRLSLFVQHFLALAKSEKDHFLMMNKNMDVFAKISPDCFGRTFLKIRDLFLNFIDHGKKQGYIRKDFDSEIITQLLFGGILDFIKGNELRKKFSKLIIENEEFFDEYNKAVVEIFLHGLEVNH